MALAKRLKRNRGWIALAALVVVAIVAFAFTRVGAKEGTGPTYTTESAAVGTLSVTVAGTGNLEARDTVDVSPTTDGTISTVKVEEGDSVSKGDVLYTLDRDTAEQNTAKALASKRQSDQQVAQAELSVLQAQADYNSLKKRSKAPSSTVSSTDLAVAKKRVSSAKLGLTSAQASAESAELAYEDALDAEDELTVKAPCDGVVWAVNISEGDAVAASGSSASTGASAGTGITGGASTSSGSSAPVQIARDGELALKLAVNETDEPTLKSGQDVEVAFDAVPDLTVTGKVDSVGTKGTVNSGVVTYDCWIVLDIQDERLRSGMSASATIVTNVARNVLLVPNSAVKTNSSDGTTYVQVMEDGASAPTQVAVECGLAGDTKTIVKSGISEGTKVVTKTTTADAASSSNSGSSDKSAGGGFPMPPMGGGDRGSGGF